MATVTFDHVRKAFGETTVIDDFDLAVGEGEFVVLVGGSGSGKSTILRMLAGLESITAGAIRIGDRQVNDIPARARDVAMVFQDYALYPHLRVRDNLSLGLRLRKMPVPEIERRVLWAADLLGLQPLLDRKPRELSGGQRQRVAMGRAMVREPSVFLFDEPLSNLDAGLRAQMRIEIGHLQRRLGTTSLYVTHDQSEAMTLADRLVVLEQGRIQQVGAPMDVYRAPVNRFVAGFLGSPPMNFLEGSLERRGDALAFQSGDVSIALPPDRHPKRPSAGAVTVGIRPEDLVPAMTPTDQPAAGDAESERPRSEHVTWNRPPLAFLTGQLLLVELLGGIAHLHAQIGEHRVIAAAPPDHGYRIDAPIRFAVDPARIHLFGADGRSLIT